MFQMLHAIQITDINNHEWRLKSLCTAILPYIVFSYSRRNELDTLEVDNSKTRKQNENISKRNE